MNIAASARSGLIDALERQTAALEAVRTHLEIGLVNLPRIDPNEWSGHARDAATRLVDELCVGYRAALDDVREAIAATRSAHRTLQSDVG